MKNKKKAAKKILIVEDEKTFSPEVTHALNEAGFEVEVVHNGRDALTRIKASARDLVLLDLLVRKIDGFSILSEMNLQENNTPVIVTTNLSHADDVHRAKTLGVHKYFIKSETTLQEIIDHIKEVLDV